MATGIKNIIGVDVSGKSVLFRPDINSPIDANGKIKNENRLIETVPTLKYLIEGGAKVAIIAHQGDTLDYQNLIPLAEHAMRLSKLSGYSIDYIDDVCGDAAIERVKQLKCGEVIILGNLRYLTEEVSTFEKDVKLTAKEMENTYLIRRLYRIFDIYVNDAFSAAHRNAPSMTGFQRLLPSYAGPLFFKEYDALSKIMTNPPRPTFFVLGGAKISDAFGMMEKVLSDGIADAVLACGVTGVIMLIARGIHVGCKYEKWLADRDLLAFVNPAKELLTKHGEKFILPTDLAYAEGAKRIEIDVAKLPLDDALFLDIGIASANEFAKFIAKAGTVFVNGPAGVYEDPKFELGTSKVWNALANTNAYTVIGGGDTVSAAAKFIDLKKINYVCTAGGAMVRFLSGKKLPLIDAFMTKRD
ncbi:MAG: phosphoglycerate kinase [Christensenellaceae bacterium]|jgi:phosphoglycerate kinase|nr:phosphoglycerate kinase [Christensenellaceae bacterium]